MAKSSDTRGHPPLIGSSITHYLCHCKYLGWNVIFGEELSKHCRLWPLPSLDPQKKRKEKKKQEIRIFCFQGRGGALHFLTKGKMIRVLKESSPSTLGHPKTQRNWERRWNLAGGFGNTGYNSRETEMCRFNYEFA